jgi:hypothetical protein
MLSVPRGRERFEQVVAGADVYDWIADFLGAMGGALLTLTTHARLERLVPRP